MIDFEKTYFRSCLMRRVVQHIGWFFGNLHIFVFSYRCFDLICLWQHWMIFVVVSDFLPLVLSAYRSHHLFLCSFMESRAKGVLRIEVCFNSTVLQVIHI